MVVHAQRENGTRHSYIEGWAEIATEHVNRVRGEAGEGTLNWVIDVGYVALEIGVQ